VKTKMPKTSLKKTSLFLAAAAAIGLSGASTPALAEQTLGQKTDRAIEKTGDYVSDSALTAKVKTALIAETKLESMKINVESTAGVVTLSGEVPDKASITLAENVVEQVEGVKSVHNKLEPRAKS
jgi:hyperosmotically inducible periplasmic protein